jgi:transketolase
MQSLTTAKIKQLELEANIIRQNVITMLVEAGSGHSAGSLGMADIFSAFYFHILNHDPKKPTLPTRDRLILSNGHICPVQYAAMAQAGYFPIQELFTLRKINSRLQGHPHRGALPGVETTSGPLGSGLSQAIGVALAARFNNQKYQTYALLSDGEHNEGNLWEAVMFAGKHKLSNLTAIVDRNNIQIDGHTEDIMPLEPFKAKYEAFNWHVIEVNGNDIPAFIGAVNEARAIYEKPTVIIAHTIPGKGVDYMEGRYEWHGSPPGVVDIKGAPPKSEQVHVALKELRTLGGNIEAGHS